MILQQLDIFGNAKQLPTKKVKSSKKRDEILLTKKWQVLHNILEQIYDTLNIDLFEQEEIIIKGNLIAFPEDRQAEIIGTQLLSLDERIAKHKELLKNIKEHKYGK